MHYHNMGISRISDIANYPHNKQAIRPAGGLSVSKQRRICSIVSRTHIIAVIYHREIVDGEEEEEDIYRPDICRRACTRTYYVRRIRRRVKRGDRAKKKNMNHEPLTHLRIFAGPPLYDTRRCIHFASGRSPPRPPPAPLFAKTFVIISIKPRRAVPSVQKGVRECQPHIGGSEKSLVFRSKPGHPSEYHAIATFLSVEDLLCERSGTFDLSFVFTYRTLLQ